jgi:hypothetical protein
MAMLIPREEIEARVSRQLQLVSEAAKSEQRPKIIFNLHGIAGIGKSCVVQRLLAEYDDHLSFLWIDFNPDPGIQAAEDTQHKTLAELLQTLRDLHGFDQIHSDVVDADNRPVETTQHNVMYRYRIESANSFPELVLLDGFSVTLSSHLRKRSDHLSSLPVNRHSSGTSGNYVNLLMKSKCSHFRRMKHMRILNSYNLHGSSFLLYYTHILGVILLG